MRYSCPDQLWSSFGKVFKSQEILALPSVRRKNINNSITRNQKRKFHDLSDTELNKLNLTKEQLQVLFESPSWATFVEQHRALVKSIPSFVAKGQILFSFPVNYDESIETARKAGNYDWENGDITSKNFPTKRKGTANIVLHIEHFDRDISSEDVIAELDKKSLRPAETHELLALGAAQPELQREFSIIALGSVWQDHSSCRLATYLYRLGSKRGLTCVGLAAGGLRTLGLLPFPSSLRYQPPLDFSNGGFLLLKSQISARIQV